MSAMASQITSLMIVYSTIYSRCKKTSPRVTGLCEGYYTYISTELLTNDSLVILRYIKYQEYAYRLLVFYCGLVVNFCSYSSGLFHWYLHFFLIFGKIDFNITQWLYLISVNNHDICIQTQFICHFCSHCMSVWLRLVMSYTSDSYLHPTLQANVMIIILFIYSSSWDIARALCVTLGCMSIMSIDSQMGLYYSKVLSNNDKICDTMHREWCCRKEGDTRKRWTIYRRLSARKT